MAIRTDTEQYTQDVLLRQLQHAVAEAAPATPLVTTLPASPDDGDECYYLADAANGIAWHLRYRAANTTPYKWEFLGGGPLRAYVGTLESSSSSSYVNLATVGPQLTVPLAGVYDVETQSAMQNSSGGSYCWMSYAKGATAASDSDAHHLRNPNSVADTYTIIGRSTTQTLAAGDAVVAKYRVQGGTGWWQYRLLRLRPIRV